ncbi:helix-turn-helix domain-containing protein [Glycomyces sp. A-F 0318]|uniref:helix-turn-helix domain-containing protein n=1 Tax=Glycomyces amatae TaxID=2881355 RepID=UPI001E2995BB|nr:helix-turn-helix transcriptional regulator [Glycomyces amatae]MCD0445651.1 helix-turn-helix domain-containing protein [Glycomyces amatae]
MAIITGPGPSLRSQWLGEKLRELRAAKKMSLRVAGEYLQRDASTMSRYENGEYPLRRADLAALMTLYDVSDPKQRRDLEQICEDAWQRDWWDQHKDDFGRDFLNVPWLESRANKICTYQHFLVYGLFQIRQYAEAVITRLEEGKASHDQIQRWVDLRMERQRILAAENPPHIDAVFEVSVLERATGSKAVMRAQLQRLLELGERGDVTIRFIPTDTGPHTGLSGSFNLFKLPEPYSAVAYVETTAGALYAEEPKASNFEVVWQDLDRSALSASRSADLITKRLKEIE